LTIARTISSAAPIEMLQPISFFSIGSSGSGGAPIARPSPTVI
jgi:hypothetical protein